MHGGRCVNAAMKEYITMIVKYGRTINNGHHLTLHGWWSVCTPPPLPPNHPTKIRLASAVLSRICLLALNRVILSCLPFSWVFIVDRITNESV